MTAVDLDAWHLAHALDLAERGRGAVEPNPLVGCVIARGAEIVGEGWHRRYGGPHAEIEALRIAGARAAGATLYVTLEPCCHYGKTPPCTQAVIGAGVRRVAASIRDPFPAVDGGGFRQLEAAGIQVDYGVLADRARRLNAPYFKLLQQRRPWVIAKWAMTADGRLAAASGDSRWISSEASRAWVHALRGRVDAVIVGAGTARQDDPLLTARPAGPRTPLRVVLDSRADLAPESQLVRTARETPVLVAAAEAAPAEQRRRLEAAGCEVLICPGSTPPQRLEFLLDHLGARRATRVLVEGGARLLGSFFAAGHVDEVHVFVAPKIAGGDYPGPVTGWGPALMSQALRFEEIAWEPSGDDMHLSASRPSNAGFSLSP